MPPAPQLLPDECAAPSNQPTTPPTTRFAGICLRQATFVLVLQSPMADIERKTTFCKLGIPSSKMARFLSFQINQQMTVGKHGYEEF
jgi:hypothetical protein